jgi:hypothetical protein
MFPVGPELPQELRQLVPWLALAHGALHMVLLLLFIYQGWLGWRIRKARRAGGALPRTALAGHRRNGPLLAVFCLLGFVAGLFIVLLDAGRVGVYPLHLLLALIIVLNLSALFLVSRKIRAGAEPWRGAHRWLGILLLCLYPLQALLGLSILL